MISLERLNEVDFVDLYLGQEYCDIKRATPGEVFRRASLPDGYQGLEAVLRQRCEEEHARRGYPEFGLRVPGNSGEVIYRVTVITDSRGAPVYVLRKSSASLRRLSELGLEPQAVHTLLDPGLTGLVLIVGETASGKTSTAATAVVERLHRFGGVALTIEQPIEVPLEGLHGQEPSVGRCIQHEIDREEDEYARALNRALRTNPNLIMLGEIRHMKTAVEAVMAGMNGHLILSTLHANSVESAIHRFATLAAMGLGSDTARDARDLVASSLSLVIHQRLVPTTQKPRLLTRSLSVHDEKLGPSIRSKIREGRVSALNQEIDQQQQQSSWSNTKAAGAAGR